MAVDAPAATAEQQGKPLWRRLLPLGLLAAALAGAYGLGLHEYFSFETLGRHSEALQSFVEANLALAALAFVAVYTLSTALSLPGALVLSLAGGFLFGTWLGGALIVVGATLGATAIFAIARTSLGEPLRRKAGPWLERMAEGFRQDAWSYMLFLRLVPVFPFWLVNLVPAFLGVPLGVFAAATFVGIGPASVVFAGVGNGLSAVLAAGGSVGAGDVLTPEVVLPLVGLGVLSLIPVAWKRWRRGKAAGTA